MQGPYETLQMQPPPTAYPPPPPAYAPPAYPSHYPRPPRFKWENYGMIFIIVGTVLIGVGIIVMGTIPGDIYMKQPNVSGTEMHIDLRINSLLGGAVLAGVGTMLEGLGAAFNVKAHFDLEERRK